MIFSITHLLTHLLQQNYTIFGGRIGFMKKKGTHPNHWTTTIIYFSIQIN